MRAVEEDARDDQRVPVSLQFQTRAGFLEGFISFFNIMREESEGLCYVLV